MRVVAASHLNDSFDVVSYQPVVCWIDSILGAERLPEAIDEVVEFISELAGFAGRRHHDAERSGEEAFRDTRVVRVQTV